MENETNIREIDTFFSEFGNADSSTKGAANLKELSPTEKIRDTLLSQSKGPHEKTRWWEGVNFKELLKDQAVILETHVSPHTDGMCIILGHNHGGSIHRHIASFQKYPEHMTRWLEHQYHVADAAQVIIEKQGIDRVHLLLEGINDDPEEAQAGMDVIQMILGKDANFYFNLRQLSHSATSVQEYLQNILKQALPQNQKALEEFLMRMLHADTQILSRHARSLDMKKQVHGLATQARTDCQKRFARLSRQEQGKLLGEHIRESALLYNQALSGAINYMQPGECSIAFTGALHCRNMPRTPESPLSEECYIENCLLQRDKNRKCKDIGFVSTKVLGCEELKNNPLS